MIHEGPYLLINDMFLNNQEMMENQVTFFASKVQLVNISKGKKKHKKIQISSGFSVMFDVISHPRFHSQ